MVTDLSVTAHLVMGEWVVMARGRLLRDDGSHEWADLARAQLDSLPVRPESDPDDVLVAVLSDFIA